MNKTIVLMLGAGILIATLLVAFDSNIKDANSSQDTDAENTEETDSSKTSSNNYQAISTHLSSKESITVVKSESKTKVANKQSSNQADNEEKESKQNNEQQSQESNQNNNQEQQTQETKQQDNSGEVQHVSESNDVKERMYMEATAYTAYCDGCSGITKTGIDLRANPNQKVIAVDPNIIPLGAKVWVEGYGTAIAGDTGGAIKGNRIDVFMANEADANRFGRRQVQIKILEY
ncbi:3D domain-containing protein [Alkalibacillus almallahensis]|uniref:3D domain-containing protein n=1 Tax=Alkalibacillus almallahensis TaxID=1379154 RepID=UPI001FB96C3D|nr:3D domain-containing protein [Alkalibacillus almallahensis]NIK11992.1 3D (Asp-Asp-Asp) domain-containing protein [Alkalibacillus almallahensis]